MSLAPRTVIDSRRRTLAHELVLRARWFGAGQLDGGVGLTFVESFVFEQCVGEAVERVAVLGQQTRDGSVGVVDDASDLLVDERQRPR